MSEPIAAYNLRSNKADPLQVQVKLQLADYPEFLSKLMSLSQQPKFSQEKDSECN